MERRPSMFALVTRAALKIGRDSRRWSNLLAFLQSCYAGRVRDYDFDDAVKALDLLSEQEQHAEGQGKRSEDEDAEAAVSGFLAHGRSTLGCLGCSIAWRLKNCRTLESVL